MNGVGHARLDRLRIRYRRVTHTNTQLHARLVPVQPPTLTLNQDVALQGVYLSLLGRQRLAHDHLFYRQPCAKLIVHLHTSDYHIATLSLPPGTSAKLLTVMDQSGHRLQIPRTMDYLKSELWPHDKTDVKWRREEVLLNCTPACPWRGINITWH